MRGSVKIPTLIVLMCVLAVPAFAERKDKPTGEEIANKAKAAKFDSANSTAGEKIGATRPASHRANTMCLPPRSGMTGTSTPNQAERSWWKLST